MWTGAQSTLMENCVSAIALLESTTTGVRWTLCKRKLRSTARSQGTATISKRTGAFSRILEPASLLVNEICSLCSFCFFTGCSSSFLVSEPFHITHSSSLPLARDFVLAATYIRLPGCDFAGRLKIAGTSGTSFPETGWDQISGRYRSTKRFRSFRM